MLPPTPAEQRVAEEMCRADGLQPYENAVIKGDGRHDVAMQGPRWWNYVPEARRFLAAMRAVASL